MMYFEGTSKRSVKSISEKIQRLKLSKRVTQKIYNGRRKRLLGFDLSVNTSCFVKNYF